MAIFRIKRFNELRQRFADYVVARSSLNDVNPGSNLAQIAGAVARIVESFYLETARLIELFSINRASGADLDARARDVLPDGLLRRPATRAVGTLEWRRPLATGTAVAIPAGTVVARPGASPQATYITTAPGEIPADGTQSQRTDGPAGDIPARAVQPGAAGNAAASSVTKFVTPVAGAATVTNPTPFTGGADQETDGAFRTRIVAHTRALARSTLEALESRVREVDLDGQRVTVTRAFHDAWNTGRATLYVDDGSGQAETFAETAAAETVISSATGGERFAWLAHRAIKDDEITLTYTPDGGAAEVLAAGVDYKLVSPWGMISLSPIEFPSGLGAGDRLVVAPYRYWTGLIAEAQRYIDRDEADPLNFPGWVAAGCVVRVRPPVIRWIAVTAAITIARDYTVSVVTAAAKAAIMAYINGLNIGDDVILAELFSAVMDVDGVTDVIFDLPTENQPIADNELARISASNCKVNV